MAKTGRNAQCPCGSGKKFKRCHGAVSSPIPVVRRDMSQMMRRAEAARVQREHQQGLGRPIISAQTASGHRVVAVSNTVHFSHKWKTFHDFLLSYIQQKFGEEWASLEQAKPIDKRHPLINWLQKLSEQAAERQLPNGDVTRGAMTGVYAAVINLAYDLYALEHNLELQAKLLNRLRNTDNFFGARYEVFVASTLIRAGFALAFEDEDDRRSSHCEFVATSPRTGKRFSVEAKRREGGKPGLGKQLIAALRKHADHERIVFIDANTPDDGSEQDLPSGLDGAIRKLGQFERKEIDGKRLPAAYVFVTNHPWIHHLDSETFRSILVGDGFQIPDFGSRSSVTTLRGLIDARDRHSDIHHLFKCAMDQTEVPATFDGEIPEFAFGAVDRPRLLIGNKYVVAGPDGVEVVGTLTQAQVMEREKQALCVLSFENGESNICTWSLSDLEMQAWRRHPDTFFGEVQDRTTSNTPLDLYDFFHKGFRDMTKEQVLERLAGAPDFEFLRSLSREELISIYAERTTLGAIAQSARR